MKTQNRGMLGAVFWFICLVFPGISGWEQTAAAENAKGIRTAIGNDLALFLHSEVILKDFEVGMELWYEEFTKRVGAAPQYFFYSNLQEMTEDFNSGKLDILDTTSLNFLRIQPDISQNMDPEVYGVIKDGKKTYRYLLLVRKDSGISTIQELRETTFFLQQNDATAHFYLDMLLCRHGFPAADTFFATVEETDTLSRAILSLFFQQGQACIVPEGVFTIMAELNPQVGKQLTALHTSPDIVNGVFFFHKAYEPAMKQEVLNEALRFEDTTYGQQVLLLYKIDRLVPLQDADLAPMKRLLEEYERLKQQQGCSQESAETVTQ